MATSFGSHTQKLAIMKKILLLMCLGFLFAFANAQTPAVNTGSKKFYLISVRGGIDNATKSNFTKYTKPQLKGFDAGVSIDEYWSWFGLGLDIDYLQNKMTPYYDETDLGINLGGPAIWYNPTTLSVTKTSTNLSRFFAGIGPSLKLQTSNGKFMGELNLRVGITNAKGSGLNISTIANAPFIPGGPPLLTSPQFFTRSGDASGLGQTWGTFYHKGYDNELIATGKIQARFNYFINDKIGINLGAYTFLYYGSAAKYNYLDVSIPPAVTPYWGLQPVTKGCLSSLSSAGATLGMSYKINKKGSTSTTTASSTKGKNTISVNVKDELSGLPISNANITIVGNNGKTFMGTTDAKGEYVFKKLPAGTYAVSGLLNGIPTTEQSITLDKGNKKGSATLIHNDPRFTVQGKAINLSKNAPEGGVSVSLKNNAAGSVKMSDSQNGTGEFNFQLDANSDYELVGKKASYISNIANISTKGLTRSQTLYVQLELGVQEVEIGKPISLQNIYYDVDKSNIKEDASSDLKKVAQFMIDNPTQSIEISSHTDARGSDEYNLKLSQERAQSVVNYLVSKGIAKGRLKAIGYGETKLVNACGNGITCTDEQHQANRRTELVAVSQ
jgi:outer membrane protein OmpA-like peptidoglycan-associated protein